MRTTIPYIVEILILTHTFDLTWICTLHRVEWSRVGQNRAFLITKTTSGYFFFDARILEFYKWITTAKTTTKCRMTALHCNVHHIYLELFSYYAFLAIVGVIKPASSTMTLWDFIKQKKKTDKQSRVRQKCKTATAKAELPLTNYASKTWQTRCHR